ncbi:succinylglutamate desuccinylase/aspartoacylase family protein [Brachyspira innocens]|uniref:Succinylglutamate desuccinylase/aspartoacylase family protein n=1 Tax=Brachyspira innocens TaxID=13264 RepID=A0ABT8Z1U5_9SPIR|nr:succinylglutamate desuccinylase/aspartoacylase family protein [Brachyspira innocens]MDO6995028.1 succinylglutamate desuccinylase/aspartoacylase family protein [Brachyspira innocens]MDO7021572.1 succinylglutamate desuccinylase/aspartoacylase family protein [Brachyspira innocens]
MKIIKYILIYSFMITLSNLLFANSFKVISRQGEASVIVNEEHADIDVKKSFPDDYFSISTKEESYLVMDNGEKSIILMPSSKLTYESNNFTLHSGYMYIKSKHNDDIQMTITKDNRGYDFKGKSFAVVAYDDKISVITYNNAVKITPSSSLGVSYFLEPNHKTSIIPILDGPYRTTENEKSLIESVSRQLEMEVASHLNEDIDRYNFKIMEGTKNENTIYRVVHPEKGPNIFLIVPHGSERVGTDVAMERINMPIKKGSLTIVPIAVPEAYRKNTRAIEGQDINNRFFDKKVSRTDTDKLAKEYMKMLDEYDIDVVLTLHEGNGFKEFFGDSIIYDSRKLDDKVVSVLNNINSRIEPMKFKFRQMYYPMPTTITYYAAKKNIESFGIELTRNLDYDKKRIIMHTILSEFLKIYGME